MSFPLLTRVTKHSLLPLTLVLAACSSNAPKPPKPALQSSSWQVPEGVAVQENATVEDLSRWWQTWHDPVLDQLIEQVLANNLSLSSAGISHQIAQIQAGVATATFRPKANASLGASESATTKTNSSNYNAGLSVAWELDLWGRIGAQTEKAQAAVERTQAELHAAQVSLVAQVVQAYVNLRLAQQQENIARKMVEIRNEKYKVAQWQYKAGLGTELSQIEAVTKLRQAEAAVPPYSKTIRQSLHELKLLSGGDLGELANQLQQASELPTTNQTPLAVAAEMLRQRPDVKAKENAFKEQYQAVFLAKAARYPSFSLTGSLNSSNQSFADVFSVDNVVARLAASLSYVLFDGGVMRQNIATQKLQLEQSLLTYRSTLLTAQQEVENALTSLDTVQRQRESFQQALEAAELGYQVANMQFKAGLVGEEDMLDSQQALLNNQNSLLSNQASLLTSWVQLYRSLGGGWSDANDNQVAMTNTEVQGE
ncbi:MAG: efflux transporter outer membrane subunit [Venatoribacter sp.]